MRVQVEKPRQASLHPGAWKRSCAACGASYSEPAWANLPLASMLGTEALQAHLSVPVLWRAERRACRCGELLAALVPVPATGVED